MRRYRFAGCAIPVAIVMFLFTFMGVSNNAEIYQSSRTHTPDVETSTPPLILTVQPPVEDTYFVVEDNQILYGHRYTFDCQYVIAGHILDIHGEPLSEDVMVVIKMIDDIENTPLGYSRPGDDPSLGPSGWAAVVVNWEVDYVVWLMRMSTGTRISPLVIVPTEDCENNLAIVNFIQVSPLP